MSNPISDFFFNRRKKRTQDTFKGCVMTVDHSKATYMVTDYTNFNTTEILYEVLTEKAKWHYRMRNCKVTRIG